MRFKKRSHLCNIKVQSEAEKVDIEATAKYPENIAKTINWLLKRDNIIHT